MNVTIKHLHLQVTNFLSQRAQKMRNRSLKINIICRLAL